MKEELLKDIFLAFEPLRNDNKFPFKCNVTVGPNLGELKIEYILTNTEFNINLWIQKQFYPIKNKFNISYEYEYPKLHSVESSKGNTIEKFTIVIPWLDLEPIFKNRKQEFIDFIKELKEKTINFKKYIFLEECLNPTKSI